MEKSNTRKGRRKSNTNNKKIPTFGDWESVNEMPITQYFDDARQAGLIKIQPNHDSGNFNYIHPNIANCNAQMYTATDFHQQQQYYPPCPPQMQMTNNNKDTRRRSQQLQRSQEMMTPGSCHKQRGTNNKTEAVVVVHSVKTATEVPPSKPKPVDEDLYKIPPHLLLIHSSSLPSPPRRRKKKLGFISRCLVPCAA